MKDIDTLTKELRFYAEADRATGSHAAVWGWYTHELTEAERLLFLDHYRMLMDLAVEELKGWFQAMAPAVKSFQEQIVRMGEAFASTYAAGVKVPAWYAFPDLFRERAYRAYANQLNLTRPRGRKLSWRTLNRAQRGEAISWWKAQQACGNAVWPEW